jgi:hypothetical protein
MALRAWFRTLVGNVGHRLLANPGTSEMHFVAALDRVEGCAVSSGFSRGSSRARPTRMGGCSTVRPRRFLPVGFFAYPDKPSEFFQPGTRIFTLARIDSISTG